MGVARHLGANVEIPPSGRLISNPEMGTLFGG